MRSPRVGVPALSHGRLPQRLTGVRTGLRFIATVGPIQILIVERGETERYPPQGSRRTSGQPTAMVSDGRACRAGRSASGSRT